MANIKSKIKSITKMQKARAKNNAIKSRVKTAIKKAKIAISTDASNKSDLIAKAHSEISKAKSKGVFHKNKANRKISRLNLFANTYTTPAQ